MCHAKTMSPLGRKNLKTCFQKCHYSAKIEQDFRQRMTSKLQKCANKENAMVSEQSRKRKREATLEKQQENEVLEE